jgi:pimeloyl-ACP methyl ester carboxylesterase
MRDLAPDPDVTTCRLRVEGRAVRLHRKGQGRPVLLLHGNGSFGAEILSAFPAVAGIEWIAPDRPGYGQSDPFAAGQEGPRRYAGWAAALIAALGYGRLPVVAHSLSAGAALWLAALHGGRVSALVLLAPFCRPTPHRLMPGLRLAVAPVVGGLVRRRLLPVVAPRLDRRVRQAMVAPAPLSPALARLSLAPAFRSRSILTLAAELQRFNSGMAGLSARRPLTLPVTALFGGSDRTADPDWHGPWLAARVPGLRSLRLAGAGHAIHHAAPAPVLAADLAALEERPATCPSVPPCDGWSAIQP